VRFSMVLRDVARLVQGDSGGRGRHRYRWTSLPVALVRVRFDGGVGDTTTGPGVVRGLRRRHYRRVPPVDGTGHRQDGGSSAYNVPAPVVDANGCRTPRLRGRSRRRLWSGSNQHQPRRRAGPRVFRLPLQRHHDLTNRYPRSFAPAPGPGETLTWCAETARCLIRENSDP
jgi:hypothetical protein